VNSRLAEILVEKREEVHRLKERGLPWNRVHDPSPPRDFRGAISVPDRVNLIAEIKFASPSAGIIRKDGDPLIIGQTYEKAGAAAISLLTDKRFFNGGLEVLPRLKKAVSLPVLRKDFIVDEIQVRESFMYGADAILLIVRLLSQQQLKSLIKLCKDLGMDALVEVHDKKDLENALESEANIIGINNRDLETFEVDLRTTMALAPLLPNRHISVSESGISNKDDIQLLTRSGINAVLVGSSIMRSDDLFHKARELVLAGKRPDGKG
jgi:indole-3-glycerol phosphate synthase